MSIGCGRERVAFAHCRWGRRSGGRSLAGRSPCESFSSGVYLALCTECQPRRSISRSTASFQIICVLQVFTKVCQSCQPTDKACGDGVVSGQALLAMSLVQPPPDFGQTLSLGRSSFRPLIDNVGESSMTTFTSPPSSSSQCPSQASAGSHPPQTFVQVCTGASWSACFVFCLSTGHVSPLHVTLEPGCVQCTRRGHHTGDDDEGLESQGLLCRGHHQLADSDTDHVN